MASPFIGAPPFFWIIIPETPVHSAFLTIAPKLVITDDAIQLTTDDFGAEGKLQLSAGKKRHAILTLI